MKRNGPKINAKGFASYRPPQDRHQQYSGEATPPSESQLFAPEFMEQIEVVFPMLSAPLRDELKRFLETQGVTEAR